MAGGDPSSPKKSDATTQPYRRADKVKGKTVYQKQAEKKYGKGVTALDIVKSKIKKSGGKIMGEETLQEKSQEGGRSNFGKASVRNMRRFGYGGNNAARLGQGEKRGEAIDKRTAEHKAGRGVKGSTQKREDKMKPVKWSDKNNNDNRTEQFTAEMFGGSSSGGRADRGDEVGRRERVKRAQEKIAKRKAVKDTPISDYKPSPAMARYLAKTKKEEFTAEAMDSGSGVGYEPGKPAAKLGAIKLISKKEADAARERILAKTKAKREAAKKKMSEGMYDIDPKAGKSPVASSVEKGNKKTGDKRLRHFAKLAKKMVGEAYGGKGVSRQARLKSIHPPTAKAAIKNIPTETDRGSGNKANKRIPENKRAGVIPKPTNPSNVIPEETLNERQKDSDGQRLSQERGRSNYGKASIRNFRATGTGGNAADPAERLVAMDARHKAHKEKRGVKTKGMKEEVYTGPKKGDLKGYGSKAFKEYEKNMDPKKRQALKDKATKGMKFTHEGKDTSAMKKFLDDKAKKLEKKRNSQSDAAKNNPHFDSTSSMPRSRSYAGLQLNGDSRLGKILEGITAKERMKRDAGAIAKKKMRQKEHNKYVNFLNVDEALHPNVAKNDAINKANAMKRAKERKAKMTPSPDVKAAAHRQYKAGSPGAAPYTNADKKKIQKFNEETILETPKGDAGKDTPTKQADRAARSYGSGYGAKYNAPARKTIHKMKRGVKKYKGEKENNDGSTKMTNFIDDRKSHFHTQGKSYDEPSRKKMKKEEVAISEKIKYDSKGSSMDYFLGKDPKKTKYYKDNKKKNESKSSCECKHESFSDFLKEGNATGRMLQKSKTQVTGHISADRGSDEKKNQSKRKGLEKDLKKHGIGHKKGVGEYKYDSGETGREVSYQTSKPDKMSKRRFGKVMRRLGRKHGQESVITKDKDKPAKLHTTEKGSKQKSETLGKSKAGKHPKGYGETSGTKVRSAKLPKKTNKSSYHYG